MSDKPKIKLWGVFTAPANKIPLTVVDADNALAARQKAEHFGFRPQFVSKVEPEEAKKAIIISPRMARVILEAL
jgi:hypothetical protein